jgi:hypothetical protein
MGFLLNLNIPTVFRLVLSLGEPSRKEFSGPNRLRNSGGGLNRGLDTENQYLRTAVIWSLEELGEPSVEPLIKAMASPNKYVRLYARFALAQINKTRARGSLIQALNDIDSEVRLKAVSSLEMIDDSRVVPALISAVQFFRHLKSIASEVHGAEDKERVHHLPTHDDLGRGLPLTNHN